MTPVPVHRGNATAPKAGCPFCAFTLGDSKGPIFYEDTLFVGALATEALTRGHSLVIPRRHVEALGAFTRAELTGLGAALNSVAHHVARLAPTYNISLNFGSMAGQHVPHLHFHVIPRYSDGKGSLTAGVAWGNDQPKKRVTPVEEAELLGVLSSPE